MLSNDRETKGGRVKTVPTLLAGTLVIALFLPATALAKRPPSRESPYVSDILQKALDQEKTGQTSEAEETLLDLYESLKKDHFREEHQWLSYMNTLRNIISFYYRQANYKEADWYHREYADELEGDRDESGMHAMIVFDVKTIAENLIEGGHFRRAEDTFLYLKDRLEDRLGYDHWLVRLVYKNMVGLYLKMGNAEMAEKYRRELNPEDPVFPDP